MRPDRCSYLSLLATGSWLSGWPGPVAASFMGKIPGGSDDSAITGVRLPRMERVLVLGSGGAGKSTLAAELGRRLGLPVIHLDREYWRPGWRESGQEEWAVRVQQLCRGRHWVMDGDYRGTLKLRFAACDGVIFLDLPRWLCLLRVLWRSIRYLGRTRPDMSDGCPERLPRPHFLRSILGYRQERLPMIVDLLARPGSRSVYVLRSPAEVQRFLQELVSQEQSQGCR